MSKIRNSSSFTVLFEMYLIGKISHERIDTYVNLVLKTLDPDDYYDLEFQQDDGWQYIRIEVWDRVLH